MRLYLDNQYPPGLVGLLMQLNSMNPKSTFEIIHRAWSENFNAKDTIVFFVNYNKSIDENILDHFKDGFKVFILRKPYGKSFSIYNQSVIFLQNWARIEQKIKEEDQPFIYSLASTRLVKMK